VEQFKYFGTTVTNQNLNHEEIKRRLNSGSACYHSVQKLLYSCLLSKNVKIRIYRTIILSGTLYWCKTWSLTLMDKHRLRLTENRVRGRIFFQKRDEVKGGCETLHNKELRNLYSSPSTISMMMSRTMRYKGHVA
jgi:hypothetical protein